MLIIPAIDIIGGRCVRLTRGDYAKTTVYNDDPLAAALRFEREGADMLHLVDLDGAREGRPVNRDALLAIRRAVSIPLQVGGGVRDIKTAVAYLNAGIDRIVLGTQAFSDPDFLTDLVDCFGSKRVVVGIDIRDGMVATKGWRETSDIGYLQFARRLKSQGVTEVLCTDTARDGMLEGPNENPLLRLKSFGFNLVAAGGVSDLSSVLSLNRLGLFGAVIGKALYENKFTVSEAASAVRPPSGLAKRVIPCLDIQGGRVVKGTGFKNLRDAGDPVELARVYSAEGADELVFLDIEATVEGRKTLVDLVRRVAREVSIPFCVGGGIRTLDDISALLRAGADKVSIGSAAVTDPSFVSRAAARFGSQCIVVSIDAKRAGDRWVVTTRGGRDLQPLDAVSFARDMERRGAGELLVNSLDRDGTGKGYDLPLLCAIASRVSIPVIASSGAGSERDFLDALTLGRCDAALAAGLFHTGALTIPAVKRFLFQNNVPIRL